MICIKCNFYAIFSEQIILIKTARLTYEKRNAHPDKLLMTVKCFELNNNNLNNIWRPNFKLLGLQDVPQIFDDLWVSLSMSKKRNFEFLYFFTRKKCEHFSIWFHLNRIFRKTMLRVSEKFQHKCMRVSKVLWVASGKGCLRLCFYFLAGALRFGHLIF